MNIGTTVTWAEAIGDRPNRRIRITTGVIVEHRGDPVSQVKVQVLRTSGPLPKVAYDHRWCDLAELKKGKADECQHLRAYTPLELERRVSAEQKKASRARRASKKQKQHRRTRQSHCRTQPKSPSDPMHEWEFVSRWEVEVNEARYQLKQAELRSSSSSRRSEWRLGRLPGYYGR